MGTAVGLSLLIWRTVGGAILGYRLHYNILKHMLLARPRPNFLHGNAMPVSMFGSCCELGEITPDSITESHLSGPHYRLTNNDSVPTVKESTRSDRGLQQSVENPVSIDSSISQSIRKNGSNSGGYCSGPDLLPQSQADLIKSVQRDPSYQSVLMLSDQSLQELKWWKTCLHEWNGKPMILPPPELTITSDASTQGWGHIPTNCKQGEVGNDRTRVSYKLSRTTGSVVGLKNLRQG